MFFWTVLVRGGAVTCESLDSLKFFLKFHFSISILSNFYFTFISRFPVISISLSFLEKSDREKKLALFLEKKMVKFDNKFHKKINFSWRVQNPKQSMSGLIFEI